MNLVEIYESIRDNPDLRKKFEEEWIKEQIKSITLS